MIHLGKPINWIQWLTLITTVIVAVTLPIIVWQLEQVNQHRTDALRTLVCFFEQRALQSPDLTSRQKHQAVVIYTQALQQINSKPCISN